MPLWAHGRGTIMTPENVPSLYVARDFKLQSVSLKVLVCLLDGADEHTDASGAAAMDKTALGESTRKFRIKDAAAKAGTTFCPAARSRSLSSPVYSRCSRVSCSSTRRQAPLTLRQFRRFTRRPRIILKRRS